jgi:hypothetical protein
MRKRIYLLVVMGVTAVALAALVLVEGFKPCINEEESARYGAAKIRAGFQSVTMLER